MSEIAKWVEKHNKKVAKHQPKPILGFKGAYRYLSNFWSAKVTYEGIEYPATEHAYQAAKVAPDATMVIEDEKGEPVTVNIRQHMATVTAGESKKLSRKAPVLPDWESRKVAVMEELLRQKFAIPELREKLLATGEVYLEETNHWGDTYWGVCKGKGENTLGKLLMKIRSEIGGNNVPNTGEKEAENSSPEG